VQGFPPGAVRDADALLRQTDPRKVDSCRARGPRGGRRRGRGAMETERDLHRMLRTRTRVSHIIIIIRKAQQFLVG
jgi:hypothetical protein